jgi:hypothetical protein
MKLSIVLFLIGLTMIVLGISRQLAPRCSDKVEVKYVARHVFDDLLRTSPPTNQNT